MAKKKKKKKQQPRKQETPIVAYDPLAKPERSNNHWLKVAGIVLLAILILGGGALKVFVDGTAVATEDAQALARENQSATGIKDALVFGNPDAAEAKTAVILYPMNRTEYQAYARLAQAVAKASHGSALCIVPELTLSMTTLSTDKADVFISKYANVENWYVGGHFTGGETAASYAAKHSDSLKGVVLISAYSEDDLSQSQLRVLSVRASEDGILTMGKYNACLVNLPADYEEVMIEGGNFAQFGDYGDMGNDGEATITREEQQSRAADAIASFVLQKAKAE